MNEEERVTGEAAPETPLASFPADLTREEYIAILRATGTSRPGGIRVGLWILSALCVAMGIYFGLTEGWLPENILIIVTCLVTVLTTEVVVPLVRNRTAARRYDLSKESGYSYHGTVRLYADRIEKECCGEISVIGYTEAVYIEDETFIAIAHASPMAQRALLLPARCMTEEAAEAVRCHALSRIRPERRVLHHRMTAGAVVPLPDPAPYTESDEILLSLPITCTVEQFVQQAKRNANSRLWGEAFFPAVLCLALLIGVEYGPVSGVVLFLVILLLAWWLPRRRVVRLALRAAEVDPDRALRLELRLSERGIRVGNVNDSGVSLAWKVLAHAVERPHWLEFTSKWNLLRLTVPKDTIPEEQLVKIREIVGRYKV